MRSLTLACAALVLLPACNRHRDSMVEFESSPTTIIGCDVYSYGATIDGEMTTWEVPYSEVQRTPDWTLGSEPPLPVSEAIRLASADLGRYTRQPDAYDLEKVEYFHVGNQMSQPAKWFYLVSFERVRVHQGQEFRGRGTITIPVLLDGRVIQGEKGYGKRFAQ